MELADRTNELLTLDPVDVQERLRLFDDVQLDSVVALTDNAATVNRLARIERGRRTELHAGGRGKTLTPGVSLSQPEMNRRSEERKVAEWYDNQPTKPDETVTDNGWKKLVAIARHPNAIQSSETNEWYTPAIYVDRARDVLDGIDLDPASSTEANETVQAGQFYTEADDGLAQHWKGAIWLNPPYGRKATPFIERLVDDYEFGDVTAGIVLVNAHSTDTAWFQVLWDYTLCFTDHRIDFNAGADTDRGGSTHGSVFAYLGPRPSVFAALFKDFGPVVARYK